MRFQINLSNFGIKWEKEGKPLFSSSSDGSSLTFSAVNTVTVVDTDRYNLKSINSAKLTLSMIETISEGTTGHMVGARAALGLEGRFGRANEMDAVGEVIGAGPGLFADLIYAFGSGNLTYNERVDMIQRMVPLNSLWLWDQTYRDIVRETIKE